MKDQTRSIKFEGSQVTAIKVQAAKDDRTFAAEVRALLAEALKARKSL